MLHYDFEESVGFWLIRGARAYERELNAELAPGGITLRQWQVLGLLALEGELSQGELADLMHIEPPTLVGILDRMERDGWISRHDCEADRRRKLIRAAPPAERVWSEVVAAARRVRARATRGLTVQQLEMLKKIVLVILSNLEARDESEQERA